MLKILFNNITTSRRQGRSREGLAEGLEAKRKGEPKAKVNVVNGNPERKVVRPALDAGTETPYMA